MLVLGWLMVIQCRITEAPPTGPDYLPSKSASHAQPRPISQWSEKAFLTGRIATLDFSLQQGADLSQRLHDPLMSPQTSRCKWANHENQQDKHTPRGMNYSSEVITNKFQASVEHELRLFWKSKVHVRTFIHEALPSLLPSFDRRGQLDQVWSGSSAKSVE